jgi:threonine dehydratase
MIPDTWFLDAQQRIGKYITTTPLIYDPDNDIYLKCENQQVTGSFKARGALNKVLSLQTWEKERGLVTASAGNHGLGVAYAGKIVGAHVKVFVSDQAVPTKIEAIRELNAEIYEVCGGYGETENEGKTYAIHHGATWISPYNDGQVIAGQSTICLEILLQNPELISASWVIPVGGGGLISGIGAALKDKHLNLPFKDPQNPDYPKIIGVQSLASPFMYTFFRSGSQANIVELPSIADGLSGPVEKGSITFPIVKKVVDDFILVSEEEIAQAIKYAWQKYTQRIEGSSGAALATILASKLNDRPVVIILSGGNIQPELHQQILKS